VNSPAETLECWNLKFQTEAKLADNFAIFADNFAIFADNFPVQHSGVSSGLKVSQS